jgi:glyoxylase-like metal-dependent hydrolase (beta-lactamase superfamily II)
MKVSVLRGNTAVYSCRSYLVRGTWNRLEDINTLVDVGTDGSILDELLAISTGVGKRRVERIILTHCHFDHVGGLREVIAQYRPEVYAFSLIPGVTRQLHNGQILRLGDRSFEVLHTPGHSSDSICLYGPDDRVLFSGDTPVRILSPGGSYPPDYRGSIQRLAALKVDTIYSGHDEPITEGAKVILQRTIDNVEAC